MSCIIDSHNIQQQGTYLWSYFQMKYFCNFFFFFLPYEVLIEQWCFKNVHMETVRSTHVIVKRLVWCFILFSTRTSLEYPVWQERLSCWKWTFASIFIFSSFSVYIWNSSNTLLNCMHQAEFTDLCCFIWTRLSVPREHCRPYCPCPLGLPPLLPRVQDPVPAPTASAPAPVMLQHGWSPAPHSSALPRAMDKLVMKKYTANYYPCLIYIVYKIHIIQYIFHLAYGKHLMTWYANMKSQMNFFLKTITILMLHCNLLQSRFQKRKGSWEVEGHTGAFPNIFTGFGGYLLL